MILNNLAKKHLNKIKDFYNQDSEFINKAGLSYRKILAHYYNLILPVKCSVIEIGCGGGELLGLLNAEKKSGVDISDKQIERAKKKIPEATFYCQSGEEIDIAVRFDYIILSETINQAADVQYLLQQLKTISHESTRLLINYHSWMWKPIFSLATFLGIKAPSPQSNWLVERDLGNLLELAGWDEIKKQPRILCPCNWGLLEKFLNRYVAPLLPWFCLSNFCIARNCHKNCKIIQEYSVSILIPARNEAGNLENGISRIPSFGSQQEIIVVEGNSTDNTWEVVQQLGDKFSDKNIKILQQSGVGKGNAVRDGFNVATGDILMILDADFTMPPEELPKYYEVLAKKQGDFANGVRLVYPMDEKAMRFLNLCANKLFGITFSWLLGQSVRDTLCGTKVLFRKDYLKIVENRKYFGDFDPFGDFDLLFGADKLNFKIVDVPIRYKDRTYGDTNINRFRDGILLLRMVFFAARKLKFV